MRGRIILPNQITTLCYWMKNLVRKLKSWYTSSFLTLSIFTAVCLNLFFLLHFILIKKTTLFFYPYCLKSEWIGKNTQHTWARLYQAIYRSCVEDTLNLPKLGFYWFQSTRLQVIYYTGCLIQILFDVSCNTMFMINILLNI